MELFGTVLDAVPLLLFRSRICFIDNEGAKKKSVNATRLSYLSLVNLALKPPPH